MPVEFLSDAEAAAFSRFVGAPSRDDLDRFFFLDDDRPGCGAWLPLTDRKAQARGARRLRLGRLGGEDGSAIVIVVILVVVVRVAGWVAQLAQLAQLPFELREQERVVAGDSEVAAAERV